MKKSIGSIFSLLPILLFIAMTPASQAQQGGDLYDIDALFKLPLKELFNLSIISASGLDQSIAKAPAVASIITDTEIEAMGATDVSEVLETVPGLHVSRTNVGYNPIYLIRGVYSEYNPEVLVLINGQPIHTLFAGNRSQTWGGMPVKAIKQIEVIRGPGAAVYGADAFAGVINIITKTGKDLSKKARQIYQDKKGYIKNEVGIRIGQFDTRDAWLIYGGDWRSFTTAFIAEFHDTDGHGAMIEADAQTAYDALFGTDVSYAPGPMNLQRRNWDLRANMAKGGWAFNAGYQRRRNWGTGVGTAQALDPSGRYIDDRVNADLSYSIELKPFWKIISRISHFYASNKTVRDQLLFPAGAFGGAYPNGYIGNTSMGENHTRLEISSSYSGAYHTIRVGSGYHYSDLYKVSALTNFGIDPETGEPVSPEGPLIDSSDTPYIFIPENIRKNWHIFAQDEWEIAQNWKFTAGVRYDHYSDFGSTTNPRLALVWKPRGKDLTAKLLYGKAFRALSFNELYATNNPVALGNPDLSPVTMETLEAAIAYLHQKKLYLSLNVFGYKMNDVVHFVSDPSADNTFRAQNAGKQSGHGLETEIKWEPFKKVGLWFNYAWQRSEDKTTNADAGNSPHHQVYLRANWQFIPDWNLHVQTHWVLGRERINNDPRPAIDDYIWTDLTLRYKSRENPWRFAASVRNLFDTDAREPSIGPDNSSIIGIPDDLPLAGRHYYLETSYIF